jgi:FMN reductase
MEAVLISGSPSATSKSRSLLEHAQGQLEAAGCSATLIDLSHLSADALLGRRKDEELARVIELVTSAQIVVAGSPTYRASYTGLLKVFFDLLPPDSLVGKVGVPILTGGGPGHQLALDHTFRPLFASLGATVTNGVYAFDGQFKTEPDTVRARVRSAIEEAVALARAHTPSLP